jgi:hypothetical protein
MTPILKVIGGILIFAACLAAPVFWLVGVFYCFKAWANRESTGHLFLDLFTMPQLTEEGRVANRKYHVAMFGFVACVAFAILLSLIAKYFT